MTDPCTDREQLAVEIEAAFDGVARGNGTGLHEANAIDGRASATEQLAARSLDIDNRWQDIPNQWLEPLSSAFAFLDLEVLRYYLPAAIIWHLKYGDSTGSGTADLVETVLLEWEGIHLPDILTNRQNRAVAAWLSFKATAGPLGDWGNIATSPWGKFLQESGEGS